eukprot:2867389-Prymnesium_polylepis.1
MYAGKTLSLRTQQCFVRWPLSAHSSQVTFDLVHSALALPTRVAVVAELAHAEAREGGRAVAAEEVGL